MSYARPAVLGDLVYFGTGDGRVVARDRGTGAERWSAIVTVGDGVRGANLVARAGVVVVPVHVHTVGLDAATGQELWRYSSPADTVGRGAAGGPGQLTTVHADADDGAAYVPAWGASVSAVDLRSGAVRWVWEPGIAAGDTGATGRFRSGAEGVRVSGDTVFAAVWHFLDAQGLRSEPWVVALDRATGAELWRAVLPSYSGGVIIQGAPAFFADLVLVTTRGGHAWAVDRTSRQVAWHYAPQTKVATEAQAEVAGERVLVDGGDDFLYALDARTGAVRWKAAAGNAATRDLLVTARHVYYPTGGSLLVFDLETGRRVATAELRDVQQIFESAAAADGRGRIFITTTTAAQSFDEP